MQKLQAHTEHASCTGAMPESRNREIEKSPSPMQNKKIEMDGAAELKGSATYALKGAPWATPPCGLPRPFRIYSKGGAGLLGTPIAPHLSFA